MNERSLASVVVEAAPIGSVFERFRQATKGLLSRCGVPESLVEEELKWLDEISIGRTTNRKVLGCMNDAAFAVKVILNEETGFSYESIEDELARTPYSTVGYEFPINIIRTTFGLETTKIAFNDRPKSGNVF